MAADYVLEDDLSAGGSSAVASKQQHSGGIYDMSSVIGSLHRQAQNERVNERVSDDRKIFSIRGFGNIINRVISDVSCVRLDASGSSRLGAC